LLHRTKLDGVTLPFCQLDDGPSLGLASDGLNRVWRSWSTTISIAKANWEVELLTMAAHALQQVLCSGVLKAYVRQDTG